MRPAWCGLAATPKLGVGGAELQGSPTLMDGSRLYGKSVRIPITEIGNRYVVISHISLSYW